MVNKIRVFTLSPDDLSARKFGVDRLSKLIAGRMPEPKLAGSDLHILMAIISQNDGAPDQIVKIDPIRLIIDDQGRPNSEDFTQSLHHLLRPHDYGDAEKKRVAERTTWEPSEVALKTVEKALGQTLTP